MPEVDAQLQQAQQRQCYEYGQQYVHYPIAHLNTHIASGIAMT